MFPLLSLTRRVKMKQKQLGKKSDAGKRGILSYDMASFYLLNFHFIVHSFHWCSFSCVANDYVLLAVCAFLQGIL